MRVANTSTTLMNFPLFKVLFVKDKRSRLTPTSLSIFNFHPNNAK